MVQIPEFLSWCRWLQPPPQHSTVNCVTPSKPGRKFLPEFWNFLPGLPGGGGGGGGSHRHQDNNFWNLGPCCRFATLILAPHSRNLIYNQGFGIESIPSPESRERDENSACGRKSSAMLFLAAFHGGFSRLASPQPPPAMAQLLVFLSRVLC